MSRSENCLSAWLPLLIAAGLPVPRTHVIQAPPGILDVLDGKLPYGWDHFLGQLMIAAEDVGYPCFLRTGQTSNKHRWREAPLIQKPEDFPQHVYNLVEFSCMADILGLSVDIFAVREMLPTMPVGTCPLYGDMPVCREFRVFVSEDVVWCVHPYWPEESLKRGGFVPLPATWAYDNFATTSVWEREEMESLARRAGSVLGGAWAIDILETRKGWYVIDAARAEDSFHWPECPNAKGKP